MSARLWPWLMVVPRRGGSICRWCRRPGSPAAGV